METMSGWRSSGWSPAPSIWPGDASRVNGSAVDDHEESEETGHDDAQHGDRVRRYLSAALTSRAQRDRGRAGQDEQPEQERALLARPTET